MYKMHRVVGLKINSIDSKSWNEQFKKIDQILSGLIWFGFDYTTTINKKMYLYKAILILLSYNRYIKKIILRFLIDLSMHCSSISI